MQIGKKHFTHFFLLPLVLLMSAGNAQASVPIYVAVPDGSFRGIWKVADRNSDGDALDRGEAILFAQKSLMAPFRTQQILQ